MKSFFFFFVNLIVITGFSNLINDTLYINRDTTRASFTLVHNCSFNTSNAFEINNKQLTQSIEDTLLLVVINNDTMLHTFVIEDIITSNNDINPGDTGYFSISFPVEGTYRYYSDQPYGKYLGASGQFLVGYDNKIPFFWNLFDYESSGGEQIAIGNATSLSSPYWPDVFTYNNLIFPDVLIDSTAYINANVNDSIVISIVNSGNMDHVLHFHGFHATILQVGISTKYLGWEKDSFPLVAGETMTLLFVPHQPGIYPVHDHNLATLTTGAYPGGMFTLLNISP